MASLKCVVVLCLLHLCVQSIQGQATVNPAAVARMIQYFDKNVQPGGGDARQYAIVIRVPQDYCTDEGTDIKNEFSIDDAKMVKDKLNKGERCVLCTRSQNVIATRPINEREHAEHILLYPHQCVTENESPMDRLLAQADQNSCVVFYSYYSPCVAKCILKDSILPGLSNWGNVRKSAMNVFVFNTIWEKDAEGKNLAKQFLKIDEKVPLYRCNRCNNKAMECQKCVENGNVIPFCLPETN